MPTDLGIYPLSNLPRNRARWGPLSGCRPGGRTAAMRIAGRGQDPIGGCRTGIITSALVVVVVVVVMMMMAWQAMPVHSLRGPVAAAAGAPAPDCGSPNFRRLKCDIS